MLIPRFVHRVGFCDLFDEFVFVGVICVDFGMSGLCLLSPDRDRCTDILDGRSGPILLQKSPQSFCEMRIGNNRIDAAEYLNQCCVSASELESILRGQMDKIFLQQYPPQ